MGAKAKKAMKKQLSKASASAQKPVSSSATAAPDFLVMHDANYLQTILIFTS